MDGLRMREADGDFDRGITELPVATLFMQRNPLGCENSDRLWFVQP
jgi:hypothetical protein